MQQVTIIFINYSIDAFINQQAQACHLLNDFIYDLFPISSSNVNIFSSGNSNVLLDLHNIWIDKITSKLGLTRLL